MYFQGDLLSTDELERISPAPKAGGKRPPRGSVTSSTDSVTTPLAPGKRVPNKKLDLTEEETDEESGDDNSEVLDELPQDRFHHSPLVRDDAYWNVMGVTMKPPSDEDVEKRKCNFRIANFLYGLHSVSGLPQSF